MFEKSAVVLVSLAILAACAPRPAPIAPDPVYDKFGNLEDVCVSDEQLRDPYTAAPLRELPRCEERCEPGEQPTFTAPGQWPICVPIPQGNNGGSSGNQSRPGGPNDPIPG